MTTDNIDRDVEATLARHFVFDVPSDARRSIDRRVQAALSAEERYRARAASPRRRFALTPRLLAGLGVAAILLASTALAGGTLFDRLVAGAPILEQRAWQDATDISLSVTDRGYTVTLEWAHIDREPLLDQEHLWVAVSVIADQGAADIWEMHVTDANGVALSGHVGLGTGDIGGTTASLYAFIIPEGIAISGPFTLEVTALEVAGEKTPGTWHFTFDVP
jgi:hypothetical protein